MEAFKGLFRSMALLLFVLVPAHAAQAVEVPGPVVDTHWLKANMDDVVILEVGKAFDRLHIPGARFVNFSKVRTSRDVDGYTMIKLLPLPHEFEALMQESGVNRDSAIVITNRGTRFDEITFGTRLYWTLKYYGHDNMALLDGGNVKWARDGYPLTDALSDHGMGNYTIQDQRGDILATTAYVEEVLGDDDVQLVDVRDLNFYLGMVRKSSYVYANGHVKGAKHFAPNLLINYQEPLVFMDTQTVIDAMRAIGIDPFRETIGICNSGHQASGLWFLLHEVIGNRKASLHDESLHGWTIRGLSTVSMEVEEMELD